MKRWAGVSIVLCLAASGCGAVRVVNPDDDAPTVMAFSNGGFEDAAPHGGAENWWRFGEPKGSYEMELDKEVVHSGSASARITFASGEPVWGTWNLTHDSKILQGKKLHLSAWIKTKGAETCTACTKPGQTITSLPEAQRKGAEIRINQSPGNYKAITPFVTGTSDWTRFEAEAVITPQEDGRFTIAPILWGKGTAWFDDIKMTVVD
jgi:hypothetical protein